MTAGNRHISTLPGFGSKLDLSRERPAAHFLSMARPFEDTITVAARDLLKSRMNRKDSADTL